MTPLRKTGSWGMKHPEMLDDKTDAMFHHRTNRRNRPFLIAFAIVGLCYLLWTSVSRPQLFRHLCHGQQASQSGVSSTQLQDDKALVPLEAHIMSKCPDATDCLRDLVLPTMQRVIDKVNFTLSYIGTPTDNDGVECMHGPKECLGNIIELCAGRLYPDPKIYLGFTMCLSRDYKEIPDESLVSDCALEHGIDISKLNDCAVEENGGTAIGLLRDSVSRSIDAGVTKSCTVRLNEEIYCIRDFGEWKDCPHGAGVNDLVLAVEKLYRARSTFPASAAQKLPSIAQ
ncbi:hypothetical protein JHW43_005892 [Diplocarpon mali]|nr:hypothetical protein JHW43_005892 [Diplocarpon mali]